jgi:hypothetical protein
MYDELDENELVFLTALGISLYIHTNQDYKRYVLAIQVTIEYWASIYR